MQQLNYTILSNTPEHIAIMAHPGEFLAKAVAEPGRLFIIKFDIHKEATHFLRRLAAVNRGKVYRPRGVWIRLASQEFGPAVIASTAAMKKELEEKEWKPKPGAIVLTKQR